MVTVTNSNNCTASTAVRVTVYALPTPSLTSSTTPNCDIQVAGLQGTGQIAQIDWLQNGTTLASTKTVTTVAGGNGSGRGLNQLLTPAFLAVDSYKNVYTSDQDAYRIQKWTAGNANAITIDSSSRSINDLAICSPAPTRCR